MFRMFDTCWVWTPGTIESLITMIIVKRSKGMIEGLSYALLVVEGMCVTGR